MKRRHFVQAVSAGVLTAGFPIRMPRRGRAPGPRHWVWAHGGGETPIDWQARFSRLREVGIDGALISGGDLDQIAGAARAEGLAFHRWTWIMNRTGDPWVKEHHPEWFNVSRKGESSLTHPPYVGYYQWLCPTRPEVQEYLREQVQEAASHPEVDGVHLDYIRYPDVILPRGLWAKYGLVQDHEMAEYDFCYCEVCRAAFEEQTGRDPLRLPDPPADLDWRVFRWNSITHMVRVLAAAVREREKEISAAVFPTPALARKLVRQAWDQWPLDRVFPMLYHRFYEEPVAWIGRAAAEGVKALDGAFPLHAGLYLPDLAPDDLKEAIRQARGAGAAGVSLFELGSLKDEHLPVLRQGLRDWT